MTTRPTAPRGLGPAGKALWRTLVAAFELDPHELAILGSACRQADVVAELEAAVAADGPMVAGSKGQKRLHPAVAEARQGRVVLAGLLGRLALEDADGRSASTPSQRGRNAARTRWDRHHLRSLDGAG